MRTGVLIASAIEAFFLLALMGYGPLYLHQELDAGYFLASLAAALPALATFAASLTWGQIARRMGLKVLTVIGLTGYLGIGLAIMATRSPIDYIVGVSVMTLFSSALAPATLAFLTQAGGNMGQRLAKRLQWQSSGWMAGGLLGGYIFGLSGHSYVYLMLSLAMALVLPLILILRDPSKISIPVQEHHRSRHIHPAAILLVVLPFFLAYSGNEGFFTNFGLYLRLLGIPTQWVGWSAAISTGLGWLVALRIGYWADRWGGKAILTWVLLVYAVLYVVMSLAPWPPIVVGAFSMPLYPLLNIGVQRAAAESVPPDAHGAAMGVINGASGLATFIGGTLIGEVDNAWGPHIMPWTAAALVTIGLVVALIVYRKPKSPRP